MGKTKNTHTSNKEKGLKDRKRLLVLGAVILTLATSVVVHFFQGQGSSAEAEQSYFVHVVRENDPILFDGIVEATEIQEEYVDSSLGVIAEILVEDGQKVEEGAELFSYTNEENQQLLDEQNRMHSRMQQRYSETETELANARQDLSTVEANISEINGQLEQLSSDTGEEELGWTQEVDNLQNNLLEYESDKAAAQASIEGAQATIRELNEQLEDSTAEIERIRTNITTTIESTINGVVELNEVRTTHSVMSEQPLVRIVSSSVEIEATVSEYDYEDMTAGDQVQIHLMNSDRVLDGSISEIGNMPVQSETEASSFSRYPFTVAPAESIHYGFSVQVAFSDGAIYLPDSAVIEEENGETIAFVNQGGTAERREIEVRYENNLLVLESGLELEEEILLDPAPELVGGEEIVVFYD